MDKNVSYDKTKIFTVIHFNDTFPSERFNYCNSRFKLYIIIHQLCKLFTMKFTHMQRRGLKFSYLYL